MKVVTRIVTIIGDADWVDRTSERSIDGVLEIVPGRRAIYAQKIGEGLVPVIDMDRFLQGKPIAEAPYRPSAARETVAKDQEST